MLTIKDIQEKNAPALDFVEEKVFFDSSVTLADDEYITRSISRRVLQDVLVSEGLVSVNSVPEDLISVMLKSSLSKESISFILQTSLNSVSDLVSFTPAEPANGEDPKTTESILQEKMQTVGSIENLISIVKDNKGSLRISRLVDPSNDAFLALVIERPLEASLDLVDFSKVDSALSDYLLSQIMAMDSGSTLSMKLPKELLRDDVLSFIEKDLKEFATACLPYAHSSSKNASTFQHVEDPFKTLFESL